MISERHNYQVGDVLLYDNIGDGFLRWGFGKLVQLVDDSQYVHTALYLGEHEELGSIIGESVASGFLIRVHDNLGDLHLRYQNGLDEFSKDKVINKSLEMSGYMYGYFDLIKIFIHKLTNQILFPQTYKQLTCVEAVVRVYNQLGIELVERQDYDLIYPSDLAESNKLVKIS